MSLKRLTGFVVVVEIIGLGVFFAFFLGAMHTRGGEITISMQEYGESWFEYIMMLFLTATVPYVLYGAEKHVQDD